MSEQKIWDSEPAGIYIKQLEQENQRLKADAERYRYLRENKHFGGMQKYRLEWYLPRRFDGEDLVVQLDEAIDAAIAQNKE